MGNGIISILLAKTEQGIVVQHVAEPNADKTVTPLIWENFNSKSDSFYLKIRVEKGAVCHFAYSTNGTDYTNFKNEFIAKPGRWVGTRLGMYMIRDNVTNDAGWADVDWLLVE